MSPVRKRDRRGLAARSHLVLVHGGLDRAEPADPEWESFCERIGWQPAESELPDDYADRLAERIEEAGCDGLATLDAPRLERLADWEESESGVHDRPPIAGAPAPIAGAPAPSLSRARRALAVAGNVAATAVLCAAASAMLWWVAHPVESALPGPDSAALRASVPPVAPRDAPAEPSERPREEAPRTRSPRKDASMKPAPSETKPATPSSDGPGALVAQRSRGDEDGARGPAEALSRGAQPAQGSARATSDNRSRAAAESAEPIAVAARSPELDEAPGAAPAGIRVEIPPREAFDLARAIPPISRVWPEPAATDAWTRAASLGQVMPASASWSLSPESSRWYGVGLPPPAASSGLPPGMGVMAQLDVGKAIDRF
jgi:hypothetical protein